LGIETIKPLEKYRVKDPGSEYNVKLWRATERDLRNSLNAIQGNIEDIREEPPFIMALKALLRVLGREWAGK
jgi:hypothetical protein